MCLSYKFYITFFYISLPYIEYPSYAMHSVFYYVLHCMTFFDVFYASVCFIVTEKLFFFPLSLFKEDFKLKGQGMLHIRKYSKHNEVS